MNYEALLTKADSHGLVVKEKDLLTYDGRIKGNRIAIRKTIGTQAEKSCVLSEELGHYYMDATYSPYCKNLQLISKQEYRAKKWSYYALIPYEKLKAAIKKRN